MNWSEVTLLVAAVLLLGLWWVWVVGSRLDRLHRKVATSHATLDNQLVRRSSAAAELAVSGLLDPVSSVLVGESALAALAAGDRDGPAGRVEGDGLGQDERDMAESELSRTLRTALADPDEVQALTSDDVGAELVASLAAAWYRVELARRFHNEAVAQTQRVRRQLMVRLLRIYGHAAMPQTVEIDDDWPPALPRPGELR